MTPVLVILSITIFLILFFIGKEYERTFIKDNGNVLNKKIMQSILFIIFLFIILFYQYWITWVITFDYLLEYLFYSITCYTYIIFISIYFDKYFSWVLFPNLIISSIYLVKFFGVLVIVRVIEVTFIFLILNILEYSKFEITNLRKSIYVYLIQTFIMIFTFLLASRLGIFTLENMFFTILFFLLEFTLFFTIVLFFINFIEKIYTNFYVLEEVNKKRSLYMYRNKIYKEKIKSDIKKNKYSFATVLTFVLDENIFVNDDYEELLKLINDEFLFINNNSILYELGFNVFGAFVPIENILSFDRDSLQKVLQQRFVRNKLIKSINGLYSIYGINSNDVFLIIDEHLTEIKNINSYEAEKSIKFYNATQNENKTFFTFSKEVKSIIDLYEIRLIKLKEGVLKSEIHKKYNFFSHVKKFEFQEKDKVNIERYWAMKSLKEYKKYNNDKELIIDYPYYVFKTFTIDHDFIKKVEKYIDSNKLIINITECEEINDLFKTNMEFLKKNKIRFIYNKDKNSQKCLKEVVKEFDYEILEKNKIIKLYN